MKILVTGSEGTLGKPLVSELERRGHEVFGIDLFHTNKHSYKYARCDIRNFRKLEDIVESVKPEYIYHLAAEFGRHNGEEYYEELWSTNLIGTRNIAELCSSLGIKLIFASSSEIYGDVSASLLTEDLPIQTPIMQQNDYALSKWANEVQIKNLEKKFGLQNVICRFFNAYGPGERYHNYRSVIALFCYRAMNNIQYTVYDGYYRTFMYIDDFIPTLANVCEKFDSGKIYNIGGSDYRSVKDASDIILNELNITDDIVTYLPEEEHNVVSKLPSNQKAIYELNHAPHVTLEEGIPKTIKWMNEYYVSKFD